MFCTQCGRENPDKNKFCNRCGLRIREKTAAATKVSASVPLPPPKEPSDRGRQISSALPSHESSHRPIDVPSTAFDYPAVSGGNRSLDRLEESHDEETLTIESPLAVSTSLERKAVHEFSLPSFERESSPELRSRGSSLDVSDVTNPPSPTDGTAKTEWFVDSYHSGTGADEKEHTGTPIHSGALSDKLVLEASQIPDGTTSTASETEPNYPDLVNRIGQPGLDKPCPRLSESQMTHSRSRFVLKSAAWLAAALLLILVPATAIYYFLPSEPTSSGAHNTFGNKSTDASEKPRKDPPDGMIQIPGGEFTLGNANGEKYEKPTKRVTVKPFYIDIYEVTCADYKKFLDDTGHGKPETWKSREIPDGWEKRPVTGVNWADASAYAKWAGKRLPTEIEWEFAARGTDGRIFPWGNAWQTDMANADNVNTEMKNVGSYGGKSPFGLFDMIGNAWEWTSDDAKFYEDGKSIKTDTPTLSPKVIRGGYYESSKEQSTATVRGFWGATDEPTYRNVGFRCAKD